MPSPLRLKLLGRSQLWWGNQAVPVPAPKLMGLLAYLALHPAGVDREELTELLWGHGKAQSLRQALYSLRALPGQEEWLSAGPVIRLNASTDVARIETALATEDFDAALEVWEHGQDLALLLDVDVVGAPSFTEWLETERARLQALHVSTLRQRMDNMKQHGRSEAALSDARELLRIEPLEEAFLHHVIRLEAANGQVDAALATFERFRLHLREEVRAEPGPETLALLSEIEQSCSPRGKQALLIRSAADLPDCPESLYGRTEDLEQARRLLNEQGRLLIQGLGGIGKTALAMTLAATEYDSPGQVLWLEVGDDPPDVVLDALAQPIGARQEVTRGGPPEQAQALQRALLRADIGMIVLDDVWNAYTLSRVREAVPPQVRLIVTARQRYPGLPRLTLERLARSAALDLLAYHAPGVQIHHPRTDALCALLGDHPYALRLAAITLRQGRFDVSHLLQQLHHSPHTLGGDHDLRTLLDLSLERVSDPAYEAFFGLGGLFAPHCTPEWLALALRRGTEETELALHELVECGLVARESTPGQDLTTFRLHDLAWSYGQERRLIRPGAVLGAALAYVQDHLQDPDGLAANLSNVLGALRYAVQSGRERTVTELAMAFTLRSTYLNAHGASVTMRDMVEAALIAAERLDDQAACHDLWVVLGTIRRSLSGDLEAADQAYVQALQYARSAGDSCRQAMTLSSRARLQSSGRPLEAASMLEEAVLLAEVSGDGGCLSLIREGQGFLSGQQNRWPAACLYFEQAIEALERVDTVGGPDLDRRRFFALLNLGEAKVMLGQAEAGLETKRAALTFARHREYLQYQGHAQFDLGQTLHELGRPVEAVQALREAVIVYGHLPSKAPLKEVEHFMQVHGYTTTGPLLGLSVKP